MNPERYPVMFERLLERVQHDDVRQIAELQARGRRSVVEPQLAVRLVQGQEDLVTARQVGGALEERERCHGAGRVVRIVEPQDGRARSQVAASIASRSGRKPRRRERQAHRLVRPRTARRVPGSCIRARSRATRSRPDTGSRIACASEKIGSLLPSVGIRSVEGSSVTPNRRSAHATIASRSSGRPAARGYDDVGPTAARIASRMNAGVSSRGSPTPRSIKARPASIASCFRRSSSSNGYGSTFRIPGDSSIYLALSSARNPRSTWHERTSASIVDALVVTMSVLRVARSEVDGVHAHHPELRDGGPCLLGGDVQSSRGPQALDQRVAARERAGRRVAHHRELGLAERDQLPQTRLGLHGGAGRLRQAQTFASWGPNIVVKIPVVNQDGISSLRVIHKLMGQNIAVNATAILSFNQAILAAKAGATYVSIFAGRVADEGNDPAIVIRNVRAWLDMWGYTSKIIVGSIRSVMDVQAAALAGAHIVTIPPQFLPKMVDHKYTRDTVRQFNEDAAKTSREDRKKMAVR